MVLAPQFQDAIKASGTKLFGLKYTFDFERNFDIHFHRDWFVKNWHLSIVISLGYVAFVYLSTNFMKNRKPFELRAPLAIWSAALSIFSLYGAIRCVPELFETLSNRGWLASACDNEFLRDKRVELALWLFAWSKVLELADTAFITFRKQKLIFLHWFHHATALIYAWYGYADTQAPSSPYRWLASMNYTVHFIMYGYYACRAAKIHVPRVLAQTITSLQISQMIVGVAVQAGSIYLMTQGVECAVTLPGIKFGTTLYFVYLVLFSNFFYRTYLSRPSVTVTKTTKTTKIN